MKKTKYIYLSIFIFSLLFSSCEAWNEPEAKFLPQKFEIGQGFDEEYYENLRAFKSTMFDRQISFAWFGGWNSVGAYMVSSLAGLPDSLDVVSLWGDGWLNPTPAMKEDLRYVQEKLGTKVLGCFILEDLGHAFTPEGEDPLKYWGWEGDIGGPTSSVPTDIQEAAIRKYAKALTTRILEIGLDGFDYDYEIGWGSTGNLISYPKRLEVFFDELGKELGPKSGTGKILIYDGAICNIPPATAPYCNWFVIQAYRASSNFALNTSRNRFSEAVDNLKEFMPIDEIAKKLLMTEEYEQGQFKTGGVPFRLDNGESVNSLKGMALWKPKYGGVEYERSGGTGVYHVEYGYDVVGTNGFVGANPWMREAIQIMNPATK